jgi:hypothetical protein
MAKMLIRTIERCSDCSNVFHSRGWAKCALVKVGPNVHRVIGGPSNLHLIPDWCPLPDYDANASAEEASSD